MEQIQSVLFLLPHLPGSSANFGIQQSQSSLASTQSSQGSTELPLASTSPTSPIEPESAIIDLDSPDFNDDMDVEQRTEEIDMPPPDWLPIVKEAAQRQKEWETAKKIKLAKNASMILEVDEDNREVDTDFRKRKQPSNKNELFKIAIKDVEAIRTLAAPQVAPKSSFARMLARKVESLKDPAKQQAGFDKALEILSKHAVKDQFLI